MKKITIVTIVLISIGTIFAILSGYNYFTNAHVISKQGSIDLAMKYGKWSTEKLGNYTTRADLLQTHQSNHVGVMIDPNTMSVDPNKQFVPLRTFKIIENQLVWQVRITQYMSNRNIEQWIYDIDAVNGTLIDSYPQWIDYDIKRK